jgi:Xaa-Pro dipeptidase
MNDTLKYLVEAEKKAEQLFCEAVSRSIIASGKTEKQLNKELYELASELFGIKKYWHKRIVRAGKNTLKPYSFNPPDLMIKEDDIIFFDFGPVFDEWEADFGRTYVLGNDPCKHKLKNDVETAWHEARSWYFSQNAVTGAEFFSYCVSLAEKMGWEFGGPIAGHLIGKFPHEKLSKEEKTNYIHPKNHELMSLSDKDGNKREWILEIHFVDREKETGGFFEQLLIN